MKDLLAKFYALSLKMKIAAVAALVALVTVVVAVPVVMNKNKTEDTSTLAMEEIVDQTVAEESVEITQETIEETTESIVESTEEAMEETDEEIVVEPEVIENEVKETVVEEVVTDVYTPPDAGQTYTYPGDDKIGPYTVVIPDKYDMPYIVNGIDIRGGDIDGDGASDNHQNTWYAGKYFVGSNGVKVRIADAYRVDAAGMIPHSDAIFRDGTENIEPTSEWQKAISEYLGEYTRLNMDPSSLPWVSTVSSKQTTFDRNNASFVAYKNAFDPMWQMQNVGHSSEMSLSCLQPFDNNQDGVFDGVGLIDSAPGKLGYMWEMKYDSGNGYWKLEIKGNYTELIWNSIHNSIRMITPDADAIYDAIYQSYYNDNQVSNNPGSWFSYGSTSLMGYVEGNTVYYCIM